MAGRRTDCSGRRRSPRSRRRAASLLVNDGGAGHVRAVSPNLMAAAAASNHASAVYLSYARGDSAAVQPFGEPRFTALLNKVGLEN